MIVTTGGEWCKSASIPYARPLRISFLEAPNLDFTNLNFPSLDFLQFDTFSKLELEFQISVEPVQRKDLSV